MHPRPTEKSHISIASGRNGFHVDGQLQRLEPLHKAGKLGPILIQLPPNLKRDNGRLETFLGSLPTTHGWAVEFRHESWQADEIERILRQYSVAWTAVETDEHEAEHRDIAQFRYVRLRKNEYSKAELRRCADRFQNAFQQDCFVYCKHEDDGSPWLWADELNRVLNS